MDLWSWASLHGEGPALRDVQCRCDLNSLDASDASQRSSDITQFALLRGWEPLLWINQAGEGGADGPLVCSDGGMC